MSKYILWREKRIGLKVGARWQGQDNFNYFSNYIRILPDENICWSSDCGGEVGVANGLVMTEESSLLGWYQVFDQQKWNANSHKAQCIN